jgi:hypothetical protein
LQLKRRTSRRHTKRLRSWARKASPNLSSTIDGFHDPEGDRFRFCYAPFLRRLNRIFAPSSLTWSQERTNSLNAGHTNSRVSRDDGICSPPVREPPHHRSATLANADACSNKWRATSSPYRSAKHNRLNTSSVWVKMRSTSACANVH